VQKDITTLKYVGPSTAERLLRRGFDTIEKIAHSSVAQVSEVEGIGERTAEKIIESAKSFTPLKTLNEYSHAEKLENPEYITEGVDFEEEEEDDGDEDGLEYEVVPDKDNTEITPWFEEKFKISRLNPCCHSGYCKSHGHERLQGKFSKSQLNSRSWNKD